MWKWNNMTLYFQKKKLSSSKVYFQIISTLYQ